MAKKKPAAEHPCCVCGAGFVRHLLSKVNLPAPAWEALICGPCRSRVVALEEPARGEDLKNRLHVFICGDSDEDLEDALQEVKKSIDEGNTSGHNFNEHGAYRFDIQVRG